MIVSQWTADDTAFVKRFDDEAECGNCDNNAACAAGGLCIVGDEYATTLDAEMLAELNADRARVAFEETRDHARFSYDTEGDNTCGDPICRGVE